MHLNKIISLIVSSAMMASILTVPKADSKTDIHLPKSDIVFAADSEMPATSISTTTTTITATTTTPKKITSSNFTTTTTTKQITTTTSSTPDKVINGTEVDRFDSIKTMPTKTIYAEGEELDLSGLVVKVWHWLGGLREESIFEIESIDSKYIIISDLEGKTYKADDFSKLKGGTAYTVSFANGKEIFINVKAKGDSDEREIYNLPDFFFRVYIDSSDNDSKFLRIDNAEVEKFEYDTENGVKLKDIGSFTIDKDASMKKDHIIPDDIKKGDILSGVLCLDTTGKSIYYGDLEIQKFDEYYDDPFAVFTHIPSNTEKNWTLDKDGLLTISGPGPYNYSPKEVKNILIQDNVTVIEDRAFAGCNSVKSVTIPDSVKYIGAKAFYECSSLESIAIPDSIISIGDSAFSYCSKLKSITLPKSLISIGHGAFSQCSCLESLTIPDSVTQIGASVFGQNRSLSSVILPSSIKRLNRGIFYGCVSLESITIPDLVTSIGDYAFDSCINLKSIIIPDSVTSIGDEVFCGCTSLESITIPNSVTSIG
ncbi:leucine-rich repeat domain-containing protein, partial [Ruminococcus sp.]|uniref:leucine-rich repeat domain-containing protein n=1 Tax=Ruminococcus sp. TaxID=41978 RepID=UPI0025FECB49